MFVIKRLGVLCAAAALALAPAGTAFATAGAPVAERAAVAPSQQDTQFLQTIHQTNLAEIEMGNLAQNQGSNQQVKDVGARFSADHTQLDAQVQQLANSLGVTLPTTPTAEQQATISQLQGLNGKEFDTLWVTTELNGHVQTMQAIDNEIANGSDPQVVQLASNAQPVIQSHLDQLVALAQALGIAVPSGTPSPRGTTTPSPGITTTPSPGGTTTTPAPGGSVGTPAPGESETESPAPAIS